jgi:acetyl-CoA C-acetyltransferase
VRLRHEGGDAGGDGLRLGEAKVVIAGGMESMSRAPYLLDKARSGFRMGHQSVLDHMFLDGLQDAYEGQLMGHYAQLSADRAGLTRADMDAFAIASLERALAAQRSGAFAAELAPVMAADTLLLAEDEQPAKARPGRSPSSSRPSARRAPSRRPMPAPSRTGRRRWC